MSTKSAEKINRERKIFLNNSGMELSTKSTEKIIKKKRIALNTERLRKILLVNIPLPI